MIDLAICTTVTANYVRFLPDWVTSIAAQTVKPAAVVVVGNGLTKTQRRAVERCVAGVGGKVLNVPLQNYGRVRNIAVEGTTVPWLSHLDADDVLLPDALEQVAEIVACTGADVVQLGWKPWVPGSVESLRSPQRTTYGDRDSRCPPVLYEPLDGMEALGRRRRIAPGCAPFRRALWEQWPYPEHLLASFDYGLWLGMAALGARFRPTMRAAFLYRQWPGSLWNQVGQHRHDDLLAVRRLLESEGVAGARAVLAPR
jgi:glycosyltransferase involved in cell wall biosynthesis